MKPLAGQRVLAAPGMAGRPLCRFLVSLGATVASGDITREAVAAADFLVEQEGTARLAARDLAREQLAQWNPRLIHVSVTPFGSEGPRAHWRGGEFVVSAMGGTLRLTGDADRPPVKEALDACTFHAEMAAAAGAMAAHVSRSRSGRGQHVDVSIQEVAFSRNVSGVLAWQFDRRQVLRSGGAVTFGRAKVRYIWKLADGWCFHALMTGRFGAPANQALSDWMDEAGIANPLRGVDWLAYDRSTLDPAIRAQWEQAIAAFFATRSCAQIRDEGRRRGINACVAESPRDVLADPHLQARDFWVEEQGLRAPGRFARLQEASRDATAAWAPQADSRRGPLAGLRVLDFSWALVGSVTTKILGDLGADVVKVESRTRPCLSRLDVQVTASRRGDFDDKPWFAHLNTSKRSLSLDLKQPESREVLDPLLRWADVVVENFSPGTMEKLGLGYAQLSSVNPGLVMASGSVYGQTGPLAREWGVDGTGAALSGRTRLTGWPDRDPVIPGAVPYGDVIVPYVMAACIGAAMAQRHAGGRGCHIDAAMYEICVQQMRDAISAAQRGTEPARTGNDDARVFHQRLYAARGEDRWVAVSLASEQELALLQRLAGGEDIEAWTRGQDDHELAQVLQQAGLAAGVVQDIADLVERDAQLAFRGALVTLPHPKLGPFGHVRTPVTFSGDAVEPGRAPALGEHNVEIATQVAGLAGPRVAELEARGVFR